MTHSGNDAALAIPDRFCSEMESQTSPPAAQQKSSRYCHVTLDATAEPCGEGLLPDHAISIAMAPTMAPHSAALPTTAHPRPRSGTPFWMAQKTAERAQVRAARKVRRKAERIMDKVSSSCAGARRYASKTTCPGSAKTKNPAAHDSMRYGSPIRHGWASFSRSHQPPCTPAPIQPRPSPSSSPSSSSSSCPPFISPGTAP
mmetsp:Transcript_58984/g.138724  ORF Transcript_58984/g.138724 Transcript_58984/m.138724 type:complete len:201 (+) Transcript_58984:1366-1968(+)